MVEMKQRNPRFGCRRIAMQITDTFAIDINKDMFNRAISNQGAAHYPRQYQ